MHAVFNIVHFSEMLTDWFFPRLFVDFFFKQKVNDWTMTGERERKKNQWK